MASFNPAIQYLYTPSTSGHVWSLAPLLRKEDAAEIRALRGMEPLEALTECLTNSEQCYTALANDTPIAMFGTVPSKHGSAQIWLLGAASIKDHRWWFLRESKFWLSRLHAPYDVLWNHIDARNHLHLRWIRWLGFRIYGPKPQFGHESRPFYYIELTHTNRCSRR